MVTLALLALGRLSSPARLTVSSMDSEISLYISRIAN